VVGDLVGAALHSNAKERLSNLAVFVPIMLPPPTLFGTVQNRKWIVAWFPLDAWGAAVSSAQVIHPGTPGGHGYWDVSVKPVMANRC